MSHEPAFIIGNGPSLNDVDTSLLHEFFTIGINRAFFKIDTTILMWQDASLWYSERSRVIKTHAIKYCTPYSDPENRFYHFGVAAGMFGIPNDLTMLKGGGTTTPLAIQLAYMLGCNPIILLGCDCKCRNKDTDFYGKNKFHTANTMNQCKSGLLWIKEHIHDKGIRKIISCSDNDYFAKENLIEVLQKMDVNNKRTREEFNKILLGK